MLPAPSKELPLVLSMGVFGKVFVSNVDHKGLEMIQIRVWRLVQDFWKSSGYFVADVWCLKICRQNKPVQQFLFVPFRLDRWIYRLRDLHKK